ncbi:helix-turn-helix transcriptional regulator [Spelaeicoccus albus]|uniref:HTH-type transcriptional regulator RipA n=1 Tax=Spelaeicoccus albus TaxID=1280376 RepID=A0A7Z0D1Q7_9MICO|nr:helix-turn-helix transcriptional regulator [Spelaeicoccus albus]NYI66657.1 AraC-like DNA-binding protein/mannose-6-phosphate isomerase-like protein (cupin superfamily) [Spelaeicoccus albus]
MSKLRHVPVAETTSQDIAPLGGIDVHFHDQHQIIYASRGVLAVTTDSGRWISPAHQAIWVPAGTVHGHRAYGATRLHTVGMPPGDNPLELTEPAILAVGPLLRELIIAYTDSRRPPAERAAMHGVLLDQLSRAATRPGRLPTPRDERLAALGSILDSHPADSRNLSELGRLIGASPRTLSRLFRVETGMTFPQWRTQLRLQHALRLLAEGESVSRVAAACGWSSASAFIETFRRSFGHTPGRR